ncbi:sulfite exporter TauE/SafE family protein [Aliikangiella sp. G2MR2-5]|uniref:sulfite exporter TauE/SafE family protein n=1 Tax=Aliikangiella sp. G2MR2-5 TaxID=2788943 RepID=UPI0018A99F9E|nr:sulfite exporter TauE/SafE family protein [Aliikangiella sp. G2MR2-5]
MYLFLIALAALISSLLTFFSGFGLGTLLSPVFVLFFPVQLAIASTAIVHFINNCFKLALMYKHISWPIFIRFSIPAALSATGGAYLLVFLGALPPVFEYTVYTNTFTVSPIKLVVGVIFIVFSFSELSKKLKGLEISKKYLSLGGLVSGFFGGLSGNQGAFRAAFLLKCGLDKKQFVATGIISSCVVDVVRLSIYFYFLSELTFTFSDNLKVAIAVATVSAFVGALIGRYFLEKVTMRGIQLFVSLLMLFVGILLTTGIL